MLKELVRTLSPVPVPFDGVPVQLWTSIRAFISMYNFPRGIFLRAGKTCLSVFSCIVLLLSLVFRAISRREDL